MIGSVALRIWLLEVLRHTVNPSLLEEEGSYASYAYGKAGIKNRIWCCRAVGPVRLLMPSLIR